MKKAGVAYTGSQYNPEREKEKKLQMKSITPPRARPSFSESLNCLANLSSLKWTFYSRAICKSMRIRASVCMRIYRYEMKARVYERMVESIQSHRGSTSINHRLIRSFFLHAFWLDCERNLQPRRLGTPVFTAW